LRGRNREKNQSGRRLKKTEESGLISKVEEENGRASTYIFSPAMEEQFQVTADRMSIQN
jgi:hypothetical protein